jgi:palmitoyltransferase
MVTYMVVTGIYCNLFNLDFVRSVKGDFGFWAFLSYFGPHVGWFLGYYDVYVFWITAMTTVGSLMLFLFSWLLQIQIAQITRGQTKYEREKGIEAYNRGWRRNWVDVLGTRWFLAWLCPWIPSPLEGNGLEFITREDKTL